jgi:hypothetical protein
VGYIFDVIASAVVIVKAAKYDFLLGNSDLNPDPIFDQF